MNDNRLVHNYSYSLRNRLIAAFIGLAVVPLIIVGALLGWYIYSTHVEDAYAREEMLAQRTADQLSNFLRSIELELHKASSLTSIAKLDKSAQQLLLERLLAKQWLFREIWFMDAAGRERVHISKYRLLVETPHSDQIGSELFLKAARSGQTYFGPIYYEATTGEPMLDIALPIIDRGSSRLAGVLVAQVRAMQIWDLISRVKTVPGEAIYILDQRQRVIAHRNPSIVLRETLFPLRHDLKRQIGLQGKDAFIATD
ncbi:MAG: cache domain-containing protein, partial [Sulfuricella sp.]